MERIYLFLLLIGAHVVPGRANEIIDTTSSQLYQKEFDESYFEINSGFEKVRHILLHLMKTTGKMATYCEVMEHGKVEPSPSQIIDEVLPDLLIHALQIANHYDIDLGEKYLQRIELIKERQKDK